MLPTPPADTLLAVPQRKVHTSERLKRAVAEVAGIDDGEAEDDPERVFTMPPGAWLRCHAHAEAARACLH